MKILIPLSLLLLLNSTSLLLGRDIFKLGTSAVFSGPSMELGQNYYDGAMIYFDIVNNKGGVNGMKIEVIKYDDLYSPNPCIDNTIKLVKEDSVDLLFNYVGTPTTTAILPLLKLYENENVLLFGNLSGAGGQRHYPYKQFVFNIRASYKEETAALVDYFFSEGKKRIGVFYQIDAYGRSGYDGVYDKLKEYGERITAEATYKRGELIECSMISQVEHFLKNKVDAVISVGSYQACAAFIRDARSSGLDIPIANISFVGTETLLQILKRKGISSEALIFSGVVPNYGCSKLPIVEEYKSIVADKGLEPNFVSLEGYINAKVLVKILEQAEGDLSRDNIKKLLENMSAVDIGMGDFLQFTCDKHQILNSIYIYKTGSDGSLKEVKK